MNAGGAVYIEGATIGSAGYADLYPYLGLGDNSISFAGYSLIETIYGRHYTFLDNYSLTYMYGSNADYGIDELDVQSGTILTESQDNVVRAAYYNGTGYQSVVSASFFGSMVDGTYTKAQVMEQYLDFLSGDPAPNIWTVTTEIEFELQYAGYPETETLTIQNLGLDTLSISNITISGEVFSFSGSTTFDILPSGQVELDITMDAVVTGYYMGELIVYSNDPDSPEYTVSLSGTCVQPPLISANPMEFNVSLVGSQTIEETLTIYNEGGYDLNYSIIVQEVSRDITWLDLDHHYNTINPGQNDEITLTFNSEFLEEGTYSAQLVIVHDDPSQNEIYLPITLTVTPVGNGNDLSIMQPMLGNNYPNPFNPQTTISFETTNVHELTRIEIFNLKGQKIKTLVNEILPAGNHSVVWNGEDNTGRAVSSGVYLYKMNSGNYSFTKKMILMK
ncbi:MAG: choice-of-anchor D domain-containing protein [Candidatus Cloacimonadales bacterium]|nr:choice-of-anchor D domain-containing protein [Candidatus Cloacimonadales bacterium]